MSEMNDLDRAKFVQQTVEVAAEQIADRLQIFREELRNYLDELFIVDDRFSTHYAIQLNELTAAITIDMVDLQASHDMVVSVLS